MSLDKYSTIIWLKKRDGDELNLGMEVVEAERTVWKKFKN